jgi:TP53 regulating kinase-like protein
VLVRLRREGVRVPALYALDWEEGWMMTEWIGGGTVRSVLDVLLEGFVDGQGEGDKEEGLWGLMGRIGRLVASCHDAGVIHGDLTTSNIMLRTSPSIVSSSQHQAVDPATLVDAEPILIDFGLASTSSQEEDRAVDLYVLERAFGSTHPRAEGLFGEVLRAYGEGFKGAKGVLKRYQEVRMRGRKKILIG